MKSQLFRAVRFWGIRRGRCVGFRLPSIRVEDRDVGNSRLPGGVHDHHQGRDIRVRVGLDDDRGAWVFSAQPVDVRADLRLDDRPRVAVEDDLVVRPDLEQDVAALDLLLGRRLVVVIVAARRADRGLGKERRRDDEKDQQNEHHIEHGRKIDLGVIGLEPNTYLLHHGSPSRQRKPSIAAHSSNARACAATHSALHGKRLAAPGRTALAATAEFLPPARAGPRFAIARKGLLPAVVSIMPPTPHSAAFRVHAMLQPYAWTVEAQSSSDTGKCLYNISTSSIFGTKVSSL